MSVSYTHLDVYKRQELLSFTRSGKNWITLKTKAKVMIMLNSMLRGVIHDLGINGWYFERYLN